MSKAWIIPISFAILLPLSDPAFASGHLLYLEAQGIIGYSSAQKSTIFYSSSQQETMQKPSLGIDYLRRFSTKDKDVASLAIQVRLALNGEGKRTLEPQIYNAFLKLKPHFADLWLGHNRPALGLSSYLDGHALLLATLSMQGFGFDRDWGMGVYRTLPHGDISLSVTSGSGMPLEFRGNYLVAGRASYGVLNQDNYSWGLSLARGEILETMGYHLMSSEPTSLELVGADLAYLWNNLENCLEVFIGRKMEEPSYALFYRPGINLLSEGRLKLEAQPIYWKVGANENHQLSLAISFQATAEMTLRGRYVYESPIKDHRVNLQIYYYRRA